jgi:CBS domain-containing protein
MLTVGQILARKAGYDVCTIGPDATVFDAIRMLAEHNIGSLIVTKHEKLLGVITERDYARKVILQGRSSKTTAVCEVMTKDVVYTTPESTLEDCMALMITKFIRHLPVLEGGRIVGIVSIGDVVKAELSERELLISDLVSYVTDSPMTIQQQRMDGKPADRRRSSWH